MAAKLKPYPAMKDSGVPWLGEVPEHWDVRKLRNFLREVTERNQPDLPLLSVVREKGVILRDMINKGENHNFVPDDLRNYKVVREGQFVMNKMKAWQASYGISRHDGIVSPAYFIFDIDGVESAYFHYAIRSKAYVPFFTQASDGVRIGQWDLSQDRMKEIPFLIPSHLEQFAIVLFLDHVDSRIRRYIRAKQKLISLLEEQKQVIIHRAVTRGLDPSVSLKPSGVEWLGDVPEHWEVLPLRRRWTLTDCKHLTVPFFDHGIPLASVREAQSFDLKLDSCNRTTKEWYNQLIEGGRKPQVGDLIYCRNVSVGASAIVTQDEVFALGQDVCLIRSIKENQRWFNYYLHSKAMEDQLALILVGSTFHRINVANIKALLVPVPPRFEQDQISNYLDKELEQIEADIALCLQQQIILREYRSRLISDAVTGKFDVRGIDLPAAGDAEAPEEHSDLLDSESVIEDQEPQELPAEVD